jgi:signal transduction histidine kinase
MTPDPFLEHPLPRWLLDRVRRVKRLDRRRPWLGDAAGVLGVFLFSLPQLSSHGPHHSDLYGTHPAWAVASCAALLLVPLWWRRRAPLAAFAAVLVIVIAEQSFGVWLSTDVALLVMLNSVAVRCSMRALAWAAGSTAVALCFSIFVGRPATEHRTAILLLILGTCSGGIAAGLALRILRVHMIGLSDRADQQASLAAAAERARVAREMHDLVGHHVSVIVGLADGGARLAASRSEQAAEPLRLIGETGRQALDDLRRVLGVLRDNADDPELSPQPGIADLDRLLPSVRAAGLSVTYRSSGDLALLGPGRQLAVYRIVQEALTNTLKHAGAGVSASVTVAAGPGAVSVRVADSGRGSPVSAGAPSPGNGLVGMRERAALYGGKVTAGPGPDGHGWVVDVVMETPR